METEDGSNIELRSEEIEDILGKAPNSIIRNGITVILAVVFILLIGSWFFKYPDIIKAPVVITTQNMPATLVAKSTGKLAKLFITDNQMVEKGQVLALIENPADYEMLKLLKADLLSFKKYINSLSTISKEQLGIFNAYNALGDLQPTFTSFLKSVNELSNFNSLNYYTKKIGAINDQIKMTNLYYDRLNAQRNLLDNDLKLAYTQYRRDSVLNAKQVNSNSDLEKSESVYLQKKYALEGARTNLANTKIQLTQLQQQILDLQLQFEDAQKKINQAVSQSFDNLNNQINTWEQTYLLSAPCKGKVSFNRFWAENQNIATGDKVLTVVPQGKSKLLGKVNLPIEGAGKVKPGQHVNILLAGFPYMEYGTVNGKVDRVSLTASDNNYMVEIALADSLVTNYGKKLEFNNDLSGTAEIVTDDIRLIVRILNPIKSVFKKQTRD